MLSYIINNNNNNNDNNNNDNDCNDNDNNLNDNNDNKHNNNNNNNNSKIYITLITARTCYYVCTLSLLCICTFSSIHFLYYQIKQLKSNTNIHKSHHKKRLSYNYQTGINIFHVAECTLHLKLYNVCLSETTFYSTTNNSLG